MNDRPDTELDAFAEALRAEQVTPPTDAVARWHAALDTAATLERQRREPGRSGRRGFWGAAVTGAVIVGVYLAAPPGPEVAPTPQPAVATVADTTFARGLQVHLVDSRARLARFDAATDTDALIADLVAENRLYAAAAERQGAVRLARVLRAFDAVLLQLSDIDGDPEAAAALLEQMLFELDVVLTKLARDASTSTHTT